MIIAAAGRLVDALDAKKARFPLSEVDAVRDRIRSFLGDSRPAALVSSAACGADLLAQKAARTLGCRCRIVLPFPVDTFRATSVEHRPGEWQGLFTEVVEAARLADDLVIMAPALSKDPYQAANEVILEEAQALAQESNDTVEGLLIWDGESHGTHDATHHFAKQARDRGIPVFEILTFRPDGRTSKEDQRPGGQR